jgi:hypothetical protein
MRPGAAGYVYRTIAMNISGLVLALCVVPTLAVAQPAAPPPPPPPAAPPTAPADSTAPAEAGTAAAAVEPDVRIGGELALLPFGSLKLAAQGESLSTDTAVAMGIGGVVQHPFRRYFTIEFVPRLLFHVKGVDAAQSATELDLRARITAGNHVTPRIRLYGAVEPGYSFLFLPDDSGDSQTPNGAVIGLAAGTAFEVAPRTRMTAELGYQFGFQSTSVMGTDLDVNASLMHLAVGVLVDL